jgi:hypothetical protein
MIIGPPFHECTRYVMGEGMKTTICIVPVLVCIGLLLTAGCVNQPQDGKLPASPVATVSGAAPGPAVPTPIETAPAPTQVITAVPTDSLPTDLTQPPPQYAVDIRIDKDRVYSTITVTFVGGSGQIFVKKVLVRVTRSDGLKQEKEIPFKGQIPGGASVDLAGTKGSDRVEVYVTINGVIYKIRDENAVYEQY